MASDQIVATIPPPPPPSITADHHPLSTSLYPMFGERPGRLCQDSRREEEKEREREREEREGGLLAPSAGTSVEGLTREGRQVKVRESKSFLYLENVPNESVTGYCTAIPPLSVCLALCLFWKRRVWRRRGDRERSRGIERGCTVLRGSLASVA